MKPKPKRVTLAEFIWKLVHENGEQFSKLTKRYRLRWHRISSAIVCELERRQRERQKAGTPAKRCKSQLMALKAKGQLKAFTDLMNGEEVVEKLRKGAGSGPAASPSSRKPKKAVGQQNGDTAVVLGGLAEYREALRKASQPKSGGSEGK